MGKNKLSRTEANHRMTQKIKTAETCSEEVWGLVEFGGLPLKNAKRGEAIGTARETSGGKMGEALEQIEKKTTRRDQVLTTRGMREVRVASLLNRRQFRIRQGKASQRATVICLPLHYTGRVLNDDRKYVVLD